MCNFHQKVQLYKSAVALTSRVTWTIIIYFFASIKIYIYTDIILIQLDINVANDLQK
jgi:hypothetical protein